MTSSNSHKLRSGDVKDNQNLDIYWEDAVCPICLYSPHNGVLLNCSSFNKGCRAFMCDTDHSCSNCFNRFKIAYGLPVSSSSNEECGERIHEISSSPESFPTCPLCRGVVTGWVVIDEARAFFNSKERCCEERECSYSGNYFDLQVHAKESHPDANPSEIDPARKLDWENFQRSSEITDVLSMIHSEVPRGVVLGDYVLEHGDDSGDDYEDFPGDEGNWWTSCVLYDVFDNFRASRIRRRPRASDWRRSRRRLAYDASIRYEGSIATPNFREHQSDESDDESIVTSGSSSSGRGLESMGSSHHRSYRRRRARLNDH